MFSIKKTAHCLRNMNFLLKVNVQLVWMNSDQDRRPSYPLMDNPDPHFIIRPSLEAKPDRLAIAQPGLTEAKEPRNLHRQPKSDLQRLRQSRAPTVFKSSDRQHQRGLKVDRNDSLV